MERDLAVALAPVGLGVGPALDRCFDDRGGGQARSDVVDADVARGPFDRRALASMIRLYSDWSTPTAWPAEPAGRPGPYDRTTRFVTVEAGLAGSGRTVQSLPQGWAFDTGLRPRPFPDETASLLPGPLAVTRTGLTPASDDELTTQDQPPTRSTSCLLGARQRLSVRRRGPSSTAGPPHRAPARWPQDPTLASRS
jgi:hypothetical protein